MNILALDPATKTGFAYLSSGLNVSGTYDFNDKKNAEDVIAVALVLREKLEYFGRCGCDMVVYETPYVGKFAKAGMAGVRLQTVIELWCRDSGIRCVGVPPTVIKKHATGKGTADKLLMFKRAIKKWPDMDIEDDNHADALWLLDWAKREYGNE